MGTDQPFKAARFYSSSLGMLKLTDSLDHFEQHYCIIGILINIIDFKEVISTRLLLTSSPIHASRESSSLWACSSYLFGLVKLRKDLD
jgi:hypothetical protein